MRPLGAVLYQGPSQLDGKPIVVIVTGLKNKSVNSKTGHMLQTWIMRQDINPAEALLTGEDFSVCGACKHRHCKDGSCYVIVARAPLQVWKTWKRGNRYVDWTDRFPDNALEGQKIRLGSYGDPAAVPFNVWRRVMSQKIVGWTGYTHQWDEKEEFLRLRSILMASVDSQFEAIKAKEAGWRTFRVKHSQEKSFADEVSCPASEEMGKRTTCSKCNLCRGIRAEAKSVAINAHGYKAKSFVRAG